MAQCRGHGLWFPSASYRLRFNVRVLLITALFITSIQAIAHSGQPLPTKNTIFNVETVYNLYSRKNTFAVQASAAACSALSMVASFLTFYWFCRMEKRFRHRLVMLLIYGDAMKASFLFVFAIVSIVRGPVYTTSSFCQASGFLLQYGTETSDYAVLVMAVHSSLQVFRPATSSRNDGLYPKRRYVYTGAFVIPVLMSALAFINPHFGYLSQGAFCSLPLRPFWYRLALTWIPRYLITVIIMGLAVAIYAHVGWEFRAFSDVEKGVRSSLTATTPMLSLTDEEAGSFCQAGRARIASSDYGGGSVSQEAATQRRNSAVQSYMEALTHPAEAATTTSSRRASGSNFQAPRRGSVTFQQDRRIGEAPLSPMAEAPKSTQPQDRIDYLSSQGSQPRRGSNGPQSSDREPSPLSRPPTSSPPALRARMNKERARIHRQLRLIFIYPLIYILMWLLPFVNHCLTYQDRWAARPIYFLSLTSSLCVALMGTVDCLVFSLREKPWRYITHSDGSFLGSFAVWNMGNGEHEGTGGRYPGGGSMDGGVPPHMQRRSTGGNSSYASPVTPHVSAGSSFQGSSGPFHGMFPVLGWARAFGSGDGVRSDEQKAAAGAARLRLAAEVDARRRANSEREGRGSGSGESGRKERVWRGDGYSGGSVGTGVAVVGFEVESPLEEEDSESVYSQGSGQDGADEDGSQVEDGGSGSGEKKKNEGGRIGEQIMGLEGGGWAKGDNRR